MPWELCVLDYDGKPPRLYTDSDKSRNRPLGTLDAVRLHISTVFLRTEWFEEPPLIEILKANGDTSWTNWDPQMIAEASKRKLKAVYEHGETTLEMFGFEQVEPLRFFLLDVRGHDDPIPLLRLLCEPKGWSVAEMGKDGEFLDFTASAETRWNGWLAFLNHALDQTD
jgi:hypothetical protein